MDKLTARHMYALQMALACLHHRQFRSPARGRLVQDVNMKFTSPNSGVIYLRLLGGSRDIEFHCTLTELPEDAIDRRAVAAGVQADRGNWIEATAELRLPNGEAWKFWATTSNLGTMLVDLIEAPSYEKPSWWHPVRRLQVRLYHLTGRIE